MPARLPPAEKLNLVARKSIRDDYDASRPEFEKKLSEKLGTAWTFDINPLAIYPYAPEDRQSSIGYVIKSYAEGAMDALIYFAGRQGEEAVAELNTIAHAHTITMDLDEEGKNTYNGCKVADDGKLVILFSHANFGVNVGQAFEVDKVLKALNEAPPAPGADAPKLSFAARTGIRDDYESKAEEIRGKFVKMLGREDIKLEPNFEELYAVLSKPENVKIVGDDYEGRMGFLLREYFDGVAYQMNYQKFGEDDMLQEGFNEAVETGIITFRVVDKLKYGSYCECVIEDGKLYVQANIERYGVNTGQAAEKLVDQL
ncbi:hypothetical protein SBRCBS47491_009832 [Sporothrix bragantina]|uniref:SnoaL-like domain-containing protein n=1 Tax=Sporothrix bragantina TaxID=671064 RepID=A0ABP0CXY9_9PEZI